MKKILFILMLLPGLLSAQNLRRWGSTGASSTLHGNWFYNAHPVFTLADSLKLVDFRLLKDTAAALRSAIGSTSMSIGGTVTSGTTGSVLFVGSSAALAQDNSNFFWDNTNKRLGLGTATPAYRFDVRKTVTAQNGNLRIVNVSTAGSTFNTTDSAIINYAGVFEADATVSTGGYGLTNVGLLGKAKGGDYNWGIGVSNGSFSGFGFFGQTANNTTKIQGGPGTDNIQFGADNRIRLNTPSVIIPSGTLSVGANSDDGIGAIQAYGKVTITTIDSAGSPANILWQDPVTKEIKKAAAWQTVKGSTTWDPASISANSSTTTTITVTGAALGDPVTISKTSGSYSNGEVYFAYVSATNTVTIQLQNASGGSFDIASATYNVIVLKY